ncbi:ataxin-2 homolog [Drosophila novamexicana]|uniref:ataxin-2 homolog n=1 Tax=Drosophila novamexicana TaxID=47314 RepID=UPI0011E5CFDE|nr:ataxin-2 homolog [Drosophila novamexicana]XP_030566335.1 ataxin-2 homolog [Drosophila novamexicana]
MAATPPIPPGANNFQLNGNPQQQQQQQQTNHTTSNNNTPAIVEELQQHFQFKALLNADEDQQEQQQLQQQQQQRNNNNINNISRSSSYEQLEESACRPKAKLSCQCTNISIMHLFHEMKQEFPTLPDALVTQCVNENCHQRDNCIQMLKKELVLHPSPVQSYPAKVVQQQQHLQQRQVKPPTPLKPSRAAPTQPPVGNGTSETPPGTPIARPRPTTLNLPRQLNAQLQQKIQQRQQQQQQQPQRQQLTPSAQYKPLRRAPPLPPLPPKPHAAVSLPQQQQQQLMSSFSNDSSCLTSPLSSSESELSLNVSLSSPTTTTTTAAAVAATATPAALPASPATAQLRSPVRHRSVITLQPEPPYAREFLNNAVTISPAPTPPSPTSGASTPSGRKSFTSLNLTLRQPQVSSNGAAPSTIDITAGPAPSGNGSSGITYSSSSFDARRGTHKNFQLTVTDEGSVFSAGCVRPQAPLYAPCPPPPVLATDGATPPPAATPTSRQLQLQLQLQEQAAAASAAAEASEMPEVFPYPTQAQNHVVASNYNNNHLHNISNSSDNSPSVTHMPLYEGVVPECDREAHAATIERQKTRRDKLANALRDNKKRLLSLEQEINILTEPVPVGESERLDRDIKKLTEDCQRLLNMINDPQLNGTAAASNSMNRQLSAPAGPQQQPFPRQRAVPGSGRTLAPPNSLRLHSVPAAPTQSHLDFVQHHSSAPSSACLTPQQQQQLQLELQPPPTYAQYCQFQQFLQQQRAAAAAAATASVAVQQPRVNHINQEEEEESLSESEVDEGEEPLDMWACNLCTFRNHPQLNICEACENVRIQPGMIRIVHSSSADNATATPTTTNTAGAGLETDANRQQPYALHT